MLFSSITFLLIFLPLVVAVYYLVPQRFQNSVMLIASLAFYAWGEPIYVVLLVLSSMFNYFCGRDIEEKKGVPQLAKRSLIMAIVVNLLILGFFEYYGWLIGTVNKVFSVEIPYRVLSLPIGLSFYTLQALGYLIDIYKKEMKAQRNVFQFMLYMALFPKLNAGPLMRCADFQPQLEKRTVNVYKLGQVYYLNDKPIKALRQFIKVMGMEEGLLKGTTNYLAYYMLMRIYHDMGETQMEEYFAQKYWESAPDTQ